MTVKRGAHKTHLGSSYANRVCRDPASKDFGQKLHHPIHLDGTVSEVGYRRATDALRAHQLMVTKAEELAQTEGYTAHDEGLDIESSPYTGELDRAWRAGWLAADKDAELEEREAMSAEEEAEFLGLTPSRDLVGDVEPVVDEAQV